MVQVRQAQATDADGMGRVLDALRAEGRRQKPGGSAFATAHYIEDPERVACNVALDPAGRILGFQALKRATPGNSYGVKSGWGIIGTHVHPGTVRTGVGRVLMAATMQAARNAGIRQIDATIGNGNTAGLAFYAAMGFETYGKADGAVHKVLTID